MIDVDVCVVGAGPVGGSLACRLAAYGLSVAIVDRAALPPMEHPDFDGRAYAIASGSRVLLEAAGLWDALVQKPAPIHGIRVSDGRVGRPASPLFLQFDREEAGVDVTAFGWMVEARSLRCALNARLNAAGGPLLFAPAEARVAFEPDCAIVDIGAGGTQTRLRCRLVVAADGRDSALRRQAGIAVSRLRYDQVGMVCAIAHERPHREQALEHFLPSGPFAQLPMGPNEAAEHVSAIVWTERPAIATRLLQLDDTRFGREIARRLGPHLGAVRPIGRRWHYALGALHAHRYAATRLVLVGDAAHAIHPIAGQGLNLGLRDVAVLAELVAASGDPGGAECLAAYQRARRPANLAMLAATDALDRLFSTDNPLVRAARDVGIAAVDRMPMLKRAFMRTAMGRAGLN